MLALDIQHVRMNQHADDKAQALQCLVDILVEDQLVSAEYLGGLTTREQQSPTYLGQGIAIPHGTPQSRQYIQQTGIRLAHFPNGVLWDGENTIYLAVVIAAKSDEHLQVLQLLTKALNKDISQQIQAANTPEQLVELLQAQPATLALHEQLIATQVAAQDIEDFFWQATQRLKQHHYVECGFLSALNPKHLIQLNEEIWSISAQQQVLSPAIAIVQSESPIRYQDKNLQTLVCIASNDQMDLSQLNRLLDIFFNPEQSSQINTEQDAHQLAQLIGADIIPDWPSQTVQLANAHGLHARPATQLVNITKKFQGEIHVQVDNGAFVSAKSLTKLLSLGCQRGQHLTFIAEPDSDAVQGLSQIIAAVQHGLGEEIQPIDTQQNTTNTQPEILTFESDADSDAKTHGIAASTGLAYGPAYVIKPRQYDYPRLASNIKDESLKLDIALHTVKNNIYQLIAKTDVNDIKQIFTAHLEMLDDPELIHNVQKGLKQGLSAAAAWHDYIESAAQAQEALQDRLLAERAADLRDIGERILAHLCGVEEQVAPDSPYILIMHDVGPSDVARLNKDRVAGILTAVGGASAHSAIVARALGIAAIVGAGSRVLDIQNNETVLINGDSGEFIIQPDAALIEQAILERERQHALRLEAEKHCMAPAITFDQHQIEIAANIGNIHATEQAVNDGAEAIGLLRTELVFMAHQNAPSEEIQQADYRTVLDTLAGRPLVVRTLDVGGDKPLPYLPLPSEENPFLGLRGIRLTLRKPELLQQQLIALLKAADDRPLRIMFPMIGRVEEWRAAKAILDEVHQQYPCKNLQVGIMIEVPSAALLAPILAQEVDFFSIGTNDLTQYTLAIDRGHPLLSAEADGLHPSILLLIDQTVRAAHQYGKWVGICGELAADPKAVPILMGLGVDELSMSSTSIPLVKAQIRQLNFTDCQTLAHQALQCDSATSVRALGA
ncbi:phosphoenolpyruvate--protein phosphotransferase [Acinetobacter puyangensis]|uniref:phosphoenolpyruvate--protein phosphotransferase n=1 Tax=Acinetobacter puyangensis TaxID=1096779 RepID=UPI003A4D274A